MTSWVLLRGLTREAGHWGGFPAQLGAQLGAGHDVVALDLPGSGERHREVCPVSIGAIAQACRAEHARRGRGGRCVLVALSLGAMVAVEWARQAPGELAGCVLINTSLRGQMPFHQRLRPGNYPRLARLLWPGRTLLQRERDVLAMTSSEPACHDTTVSDWARIAGERPVSARNALRQLLAAARYNASDRPPPVPLLILSSAGDQLVSPECSRRLAQHWGASNAVHPSAGHDLPLDDPTWVLHQLALWRTATGL